MAGLAFSLLLLLIAGNTLIGGEATPPSSAAPVEDVDFFEQCPPSTCGDGGIEVRFPFFLPSSSPSCNYSSLPLTCSGNLPILTFPSFGPYAVTDINYKEGTLTAAPLGSPPSCPFHNLSTAHPNDNYEYQNTMIVSCLQKVTPSDSMQVVGPISCLGNESSFGYVVSTSESMDAFPSECTVVSASGYVPTQISDGNNDRGNIYNFVASVKALAQGRNITLNWGWTFFSQCLECEKSGRICGFSREINQIICRSTNHGPHTLLITGACIGGFVVLLSVIFVTFYLVKEPDNEKTTRLKVEEYLALYTTAKPTRYSFKGIKKITKNFKEKLGQGGFGSVYKGVLLNAIPVAVKMLEKSRGEGEEFINEVATIGRIHHVNIVRLLGFCSEGTRHALVYEFMSNESLEKYIFCREDKPTQYQLSIAKLQDIALGIARGIEYLHQGCDQRILHFDIKPHNILLDQDLNPKISDFGLAKLCSKDNSIITMTAARGTMGYIAPEIYSRNFGEVSYKADVYSFGMLLLDMVGGKKNVEPTIENQNDIYFPESVYDQLVNEQGLNLMLDMKKEDEEIAKKLAAVALWCIQWSPMDRPSMTKVVHMLMGDFQSMEFPPKPFISTSEEEKDASANV